MANKLPSFSGQSFVFNFLVSLMLRKAVLELCLLEEL